VCVLVDVVVVCEMNCVVKFLVICECIDDFE